MCMPAANAVLWRKDFGTEHALSSIKVDPTDWRHMCLCGAKGSISMPLTVFDTHTVCVYD